ncbi:MAG: hypothetical protein GX495_15400 [Chloroflexi bacterium]|jgi:uncharacterized membrane protein YeaQ/YmgE (transglycosylase-associated protein family)|nr:hypothetical protein [Chloroflexota bacterium]
MIEEKVNVQYCAFHPAVETSLRCNRCDRPICTKCARLTPTGYRCKECVRGQQKVFETARWFDYPLAIVLGGVLSFIGSLIVPRLGFFTLLLAPVAGVVIAEVIRRVIQRRRAKRLFQLTAAAVVLGAVLPIIPVIINMLLSSSGAGLFALIWQGLYIFLVTSSVYYRLSGIQL